MVVADVARCNAQQSPSVTICLAHSNFLHDRVLFARSGPVRPFNPIYRIVGGKQSAGAAWLLKRHISLACNLVVWGEGLEQAVQDTLTLTLSRKERELRLRLFRRR
jgi:hypothetical protein